MSTLQRRLYRFILRMHPAEFQHEFGSEMALDFEDALQSHGISALYWDALLSFVRQWTVHAFPDALEQRTTPNQSLLAGQYAVVAHGGLTPFDLFRGWTLSVMLFGSLGVALNPAGDSTIHLPPARRLIRQAQAPGAVVHRDIVIRDVTVIDVARGTLQPHQTVFIRGDRISSVVGVRTAKLSPDADEIDGRGRFLIPALWDMHTHITHVDRDFPMYIANGVLGLRNMGGEQEKVFQWKRDTANGTLFGPRMFVSGPIVDGPGGPTPDNYAVRVANADEARREVDTLKAKGADFLKTYDGLSRESYFAIADEAKKVGLPFAGHVPTDVTILEASNAGQRSIEHAIELRGGSTAEQQIIDVQKKQDVMGEANG